jgi:hypothetical protein
MPRAFKVIELPTVDGPPEYGTDEKHEHEA